MSLHPLPATLSPTALQVLRTLPPDADRTIRWVSHHASVGILQALWAAEELKRAGLLDRPTTLQFHPGTVLLLNESGRQVRHASTQQATS